MCSGRVSKKMITHAFQKGAGLVLVSGCHTPTDCHYVDGNYRCMERVEQLKKQLPTKFGIDPDRLRLEWVSAAEGVIWQRIQKEMSAQLESLDLPPFETGVGSAPAADKDEDEAIEAVK